MNNNLHFPTLEYLKFGNIFSSSLGNFNFKIFPDMNDRKMKVVIWKGKNCLDVSEVLFEKIFSLSNEEFNGALAWISDKYDNLKC